MHAQNFFVDQRAHRQVLKSLAKFLPNLESVAVKRALARILEAVDLVDKPALVVTAKHVDLARVPQFVGEQQCDHLDVIRISVHVIALEQIFFERRRADLIEKPEKILKLAMSVAGNHDRRLDFDNDGLFFEEGDKQVEEVLDLSTQQVSVLLLVEAADVGDQFVEPLLLLSLILRLDENEFFVFLLVCDHVPSDSVSKGCGLLVVRQALGQVLEDVLALSVFFGIVGDTWLPIIFTILKNRHVFK
jgi:hypothetical protein